jgi:hypothetical protein
LYSAIFAFAEVREAARQQKIDNDDTNIVSLPVSTGAIVEAFNRNHLFFQNKLKSADYDFLSSLAHNTNVENIDIDIDIDINLSCKLRASWGPGVQALAEIAHSASTRITRTPKSNMNRTFVRNKMRTTSVVGDNDDADADNSDDDDDDDNDEDYRRKALMLHRSASIHYFGDDNIESECLYMLMRSPMSKRITLIFRGSKTMQDWIKDSKLVVSAIKNPVSDREGQPPTICVHKGFREYLYGESRTVTTECLDNDDEGSTISAEKEKNNFNDDEKDRSSTKGDRNEKVAKVSQNKDHDTCHDTTCVSTDTNDVVTAGPKPGLPTCEDDCTTSSDYCKNPITEQDDQLSSTNICLNILGLDLSSIKAKQKSIWSNWKTKSLIATESEHELMDDDSNETAPWSIFSTSKPYKNITSQSRLERIIGEVNNLQKQFSDHRLYVTGHSLGGALGLIAALELAAQFGKPGQPVTFVGIANPRAGTEGFRDACEVLEREGKMRCVGVHGHLDIVPMLPGSAFNRTTKRRYCQSGFELVLKSDSNKFYMRRSDRADDNYFQRIGLALFRADKIGDRHHYVTYLKELEALERPLNKLYLNDFYDKLVEEGLFPCSKKKMTPSRVRTARSRDSVFVLEKPSKKEMKRVKSAEDLCDDDIEMLI